MKNGKENGMCFDIRRVEWNEIIIKKNRMEKRMDRVLILRVEWNENGMEKRMECVLILRVEWNENGMEKWNVL